MTRADWYVAQAATGKERRVRDALRELGYDALAPSKLMQERRAGKWILRERVLFAGYVFIRCAMTPEDYYGILAASPYVLRLLGKPGAPEAIRPEEANYVLWLGRDDAPLGVSDVLSDGGRVTVLAGPLAGREASIIRIDRRARRAILELRIADAVARVSLSVNVLSPA